MDLSNKQKQTLALAAILQCSYLIYELGSKGHCDEKAFEININSIYTLDSPDFASIYGNVDNLKIGLETLMGVLQQKAKSKIYTLISRYFFDVIFLQSKLMKKSDMLDFIRKRLNHATTQKNYFKEINDTVIENLADIYSNSISQMRYKVQIIGKAKYMRDPKIFNKIRALLLSAIRASVLWQQLGGNKWQLFFLKNKIISEAKILLIDSK